MPKQSRLGAILFLPFENRTFFVWFSNGRNKMAVFSIPKPDFKSVQKMTIWNPDGPVFGGSL
jgi:hypothetical protein